MTITLRHMGEAQVPPHRRAHMVGTVPQTGVLVVTHERNMRSKFR